MPRQSKRARAVATFRLPVQVRVERPEFELLASVRHLDLAALGRAHRAEVEIGHVKTGSCRQLIHAIVRKGMVTGLRMEPCSGRKAEPPSAELVRIMNAVRRRVAPGTESPVRLPRPVAAFFRGVITIDESPLRCYRVCIAGICIVCCNFGGDRWVCRDEIIIYPNPPR